MSAYLRYHRAMRYWVFVFAVIAVGLLILPVSAQVNGAPPSVTSYGFGGHPGFNGVPPSVTSLGPRGPVRNRGPHPPQFPFVPGHRHHHDGNGNVNSYYIPYYVPYYVPYYPYDDSYNGPMDPSAVQGPEDPEEERGGPTIFDRRGSGALAPNDYQPARAGAPVPRPQSETAVVHPAPLTTESAGNNEVLETKATESPVTPAISAQPATILVFKDGHKLEVGNYAIVGSYLFDLTQGHRMKIALSDLDLPATQKANEDEGIDFDLPHSPDGN